MSVSTAQRITGLTPAHIHVMRVIVDLDGWATPAGQTREASGTINDDKLAEVTDRGYVRQVDVGEYELTDTGRYVLATWEAEVHG